MLHKDYYAVDQRLLLALVVQTMRLQVAFQIHHLQLLQPCLQNHILHHAHQVLAFLLLHLASLLPHLTSLSCLVLHFDSFHLGQGFCFAPSHTCLSHILLLDRSHPIVIETPSEAGSLAVKHEGFFDEINDIPKIIEAFDIWLKQILSKLDIFFVESVGLQVAVELLKRRVLKVSEIEVMDREIVYKQFGDLQQFCRNLLGFADRLVPCEVHDVLCERQDNHVEPRRRLEMILLVILFLLWIQSCESQFLVVPGHQFDDADEVLLGEFGDHGIEELGAAVDVFFVRVQEIAGAQVMVRLDEVPRFESDQGHARRLDVLDLIHILLGYLDLLATQRIVGPDNAVEQHLSPRVQLLCDPLQRLVCLGVDLLRYWSLGLVEQRVNFYTDLKVLLFTFLVCLFADFESQPVQRSLLELLLPKPLLQIQDLLRTIQDCGVDFIRVERYDFLVKLTNVEETLLSFTNRKQFDLHVFSCELLRSLYRRLPVLVANRMRTVLGCEKEHSQIVVCGFSEIETKIQIADFGTILPKYIVERHSFLGQSAKTSGEVFVELRGLLDSPGIDLAVQGMNLEDMLLIDTVLGIVLHRSDGYDVVEDESNFVRRVGYDFSLQEVIVAVEDFLQLTFVLALKWIDHVLRAVQDEYG